MKSLFILTTLLLLSIIFSCNSPEKNKTEIKQEIPQTTHQKTKIAENPLHLSSSNQGIITIGDSLVFSAELKDSLPFDSALLYLNNKKLTQIASFPFNENLPTLNSRPGINHLYVKVYRSGVKTQKKLPFVLSSDVVPEKLGYKIKNTYPHDMEAFTQGLFYDQGFLYEATGLKGASSVRKVKFETGEIIQSYSIQGNIFGEGITLHNNKIIQLSWQANVGFVYDKETFSLLTQFNYPTEGWGITTIENKLYMSDGTSNLYILSTDNYAETDRLEVYDNEGPVANLNELEYIEGYIYANIYMTEKIAKIDPKNGKVMAYIDCRGLLNEKDKHRNIDVLNGIAYDAQTKRIFITGKKWPKLFEIEIIKL